MTGVAPPLRLLPAEVEVPLAGTGALLGIIDGVNTNNNGAPPNADQWGRILAAARVVDGALAKRTDETKRRPT